MIKATARAGTFVHAKGTHYKHRTVSALVCLAPATEVEACDARLKHLQFDVCS